MKINRWNYEEVPKEERPHPDGEGLLGLMGSLRRVNERLETIEHHGYVNFYSNIGDDWYEFLQNLQMVNLYLSRVGRR